MSAPRLCVFGLSLGSRSAGHLWPRCHFRGSERPFVLRGDPPQRLSAMAGTGQLSSVPEVEIDPDGTFKYILVRVQHEADNKHRDIVRGTAAAEFHNHIFEKVNPEMEKLGFVCKCLGGGKIEHNSKEKKIRVFGLSTGYGKADHAVTVELLKKTYKDYEISWSDDKK